MTAEPVPTPRCRRIVDTAAQIARADGRPYAGVEHLFLAPIRDLDAVPTQVLAGHVSLPELEGDLPDLMSSPGYNA